MVALPLEVYPDETRRHCPLLKAMDEEHNRRAVKLRRARHTGRERVRCCEGRTVIRRATGKRATLRDVEKALRDVVEFAARIAGREGDGVEPPERKPPECWVPPEVLLDYDVASALLGRLHCVDRLKSLPRDAGGVERAKEVLAAASKPRAGAYTDEALVAAVRGFYGWVCDTDRNDPLAPVATPEHVDKVSGLNGSSTEPR